MMRNAFMYYLQGAEFYQLESRSYLSKAFMCCLYIPLEHTQNVLSIETFTGQSCVLKYVYLQTGSRCVIVKSKSW